jgi:hypothetical protein
VIVVALDEDDVPKDIQQRDEALQKLFKPALTEQAKLLLHDNTKSSAHKVLRTMLGNRPASLLIQRELADDRKELWSTHAGIELRGQMEELANDLRKIVQKDNSKGFQEKLDKLNADLFLIEKSLQEVQRAKVSTASFCVD